MIEAGLEGRESKENYFNTKRIGMKTSKSSKKNYQLRFKTKIPSTKEYITEEEYFDYYQNACDPTFENYPFPSNDNSKPKLHNQETDADELPF